MSAQNRSSKHVSDLLRKIIGMLSLDLVNLKLKKSPEFGITYRHAVIQLFPIEHHGILRAAK